MTRTRTAALAFLLAAAAGCDRAEAPKTEPHDAAPVEQDAVKRRLADPAYVKRLHERADGRKELMKEILDVEKRLAEAKAAEPADAELVSRLEGLLADRRNILVKYETESRRIVAAQIRGDLEKNGNLNTKKGE